MFCLPHKDEGLVTNQDGKQVWFKGETTKKRKKICSSNATRSMGL